MYWKGKTAVITGAASGIGKAVAMELASLGANLALVDINHAQLLQIQKALCAVNPAAKITIHQLDVSDQEAWCDIVAEIDGNHVRVDALFNNAGITFDKSFTGHSLDDWNKILGVNWYGVLYGCHYFVPILERTAKQFGAAHIINTSSLAGFMGIPTQSSYCVTKAAVRAFSESLYAELKPKNIHVLSLHPGAVKTNIFAAAVLHAEKPEQSKKMFDAVAQFAMPPEKAARKIVKATEQKRQRLVICLDAKIVDIAKRLMPSLLHKVFAWAFAKAY